MKLKRFSKLILIFSFTLNKFKYLGIAKTCSEKMHLTKNRIQSLPLVKAFNPADVTGGGRDNIVSIPWGFEPCVLS